MADLLEKVDAIYEASGCDRMYSTALSTVVRGRVC